MGVKKKTLAVVASVAPLLWRNAHVLNMDLKALCWVLIAVIVITTDGGVSQCSGGYQPSTYTDVNRDFDKSCFALGLNKYAYHNQYILSGEGQAYGAPPPASRWTSIRRCQNGRIELERNVAQPCYKNNIRPTCDGDNVTISVPKAVTCTNDCTNVYCEVCQRVDCVPRNQCDMPLSCDTDSLCLSHPISGSWCQKHSKDPLAGVGGRYPFDTCTKSYGEQTFYVHRVYLRSPPTTYSVTISPLRHSQNQTVVLAGRSCENPLISLPSYSSPGGHARYLDLNFMKPYLMSTENEMFGVACFKNGIVTWVKKSLIVTTTTSRPPPPPPPTRPRPPRPNLPQVSRPRPDTGSFNTGPIYRPVRSIRVNQDVLARAMAATTTTRAPRKTNEPLTIVVDGLGSVPYKVEPIPMRYVIPSDGPTDECVTDNDDLGGLGACRGETPDGCFCTRHSIDDDFEYRCLPNFIPKNVDIGPSGGCEPVSIHVHTFDDADNSTNSTNTDPWESCGHVKPADDASEPPIPLDNSGGVCAQRSVYTPPELTCATPEAKFRVIYSHLNREDDDVFIPAGTNAVVTVSSERKVDLLYGSAQATVYQKNLDVIEREVYRCQKYVLVLNRTAVKLYYVIPISSNISLTVEPLPVDDDECKQWWSTRSACASLREAAADYNADMPEKCEMKLPDPWSNYLTTYKILTVSESFFGVKRVVHASVKRIKAKLDVTRLSDGLVANPDIPTGKIDTLVGDTNVLPVGRYVTPDKNYTFVFTPIPRQAMCSHREMFRGSLSIAAFDKTGMTMPYFEAGETRRHEYYILKNGVHHFSRTIKASAIKDSPTSRFPLCYNPPPNSQIVDVGNILIHLIIDQPPSSTTDRRTDDIHCAVSSDPFPYHDLSAVSAAPYSTRPTDLPRAIRWRYSSMNNRDNSSVVVECYSNAVVVWSRPDVIISHVKYVSADTGRVAFANSYPYVGGAERRSPPPPSLNPESLPCLLTGPADKCHWFSHCESEKYCSDQADTLQCLCKSDYDDIGGQCVVNNVCLPGFVYSKSDGGCNDIDECAQPSGNPCANRVDDGRTACMNTIGSFECVEPLRCPATSRLNEESGECEDINECANDDANDCDHELSTCRNLSPGYECICNNQWTHYQSADRKTCLQYSFEVRLLHPRFIRCCSHHHEMSAMLAKCRIDPSSDDDLVVYNHVEPFVCAEFSFADSSDSPRSVVGSPFSTTRSNMSGELESILQLSSVIQTELNLQEKERLGIDAEFVLNTLVDRRMYHGRASNPVMKRSITRAITYNIRSVGQQYFIPYSGSDRQTAGCQDIRTIGTLNEHIAQPRPSRLSHSLPAVMDERNGVDKTRGRVFAYTIVSLFTLQVVTLMLL